jgi:hypothetical protein
VALGNDLRTAAVLVAAADTHESLPLGHPDRPILAGGLAAMTAEAWQDWIHVHPPDEANQPWVTLIAGPIFEGRQILGHKENDYGAILLPNHWTDRASGLLHWSISGSNLFRGNPKGQWEPGFDEWVRAATVSKWARGPALNAARIAAAYLQYRDFRTGQEKRGAQAGQRAKLLPRILFALGAPSLAALPAEWKAALETPDGLDVFAGADYWVSNAKGRSVTQVCYSLIPEPFPQHIPLEILHNRRELSIAQALVWFFVQEHGLSPAAAALVLGMTSRQEVHTHLVRAKEKLGEKAGKFRLHGRLPYEPAAQGSPRAEIIPLVDGTAKRPGTKPREKKLGHDAT